MKITLQAPSPASGLAVTYVCPNRHHDIRFYRSEPVWSTVICTICGEVTEIPRSEYLRHAQLGTSLREWVV